MSASWSPPLFWGMVHCVVDGDDVAAVEGEVVAVVVLVDELPEFAAGGDELPQAARPMARKSDAKQSPMEQLLFDPIKPLTAGPVSLDLIW